MHVDELLLLGVLLERRVRLPHQHVDLLLDLARVELVLRAVDVVQHADVLEEALRLLGQRVDREEELLLEGAPLLPGGRGRG